MSYDSSINIDFNINNNALEIDLNNISSMADNATQSMASLSAGVNTVGQSFARAISESGQFYTALEGQSTTFAGELANLKDNSLALLGGIGDNLCMQLAGSAFPVVNGWLTEMKSAFENGGLTAFLESLNNIFTQAVQATKTQLPTIIATAENIIQSLMLGINQNLPQILLAAGEIILNLCNGIFSLLPILIQTGIDILVSFIDGIVAILPTLIPVLINALLDSILTLVNNVEILIAAGISLLTAIVDGVLAAIPILVKKAPEIITSFLSGIISCYPMLLQAGVNLLIKIKDGISQLLDSIPELGLAVVKGLWNGILGAGAWLIDNVKSWCGTIVDAIKSFFGIHSPSKLLAEEVGAFLPPGITLGFASSMPLALANVKKQMSDIVSTAKVAVSPLTQGLLSNFSLSELTPLDMSRYISQMRSAASQAQSTVATRFAAQVDFASLQLYPSSAGTSVTFNQTNVSPEPLSPSQLTRNAQDMLNWQQNKWRLP